MTWNIKILSKYPNEVKAFDFIKKINDDFCGKSLNNGEDYYKTGIKYTEVYTNTVELASYESFVKTLKKQYGKLCKTNKGKLSEDKKIYKELYKSVASKILHYEKIFVCPICGKTELLGGTGGNFKIPVISEIDHVKSFASGPKKRLDPYNMIYICRVCNNKKSSSKSKISNYPYCFLKEYRIDFFTNKRRAEIFIGNKKASWLEEVYGLETNYGNLNMLQQFSDNYNLMFKVGPKIGINPKSWIRGELFMKKLNTYRLPNSKLESEFIKYWLKINK